MRGAEMIYSFAGVTLDEAAHRVTRDGQIIPVEPQVFDILRLLAENGGSLVSKEDLIDAVWGGRIVSEATISARINAARKAVGDELPPGGPGDGLTGCRGGSGATPSGGPRGIYTTITISVTISTGYGLTLRICNTPVPTTRTRP